MGMNFPHKSWIVFILLAGTVSGCIGANSGRSGRQSSNAAVSNSTFSVGEGYGRILHDNPIILSNNTNLEATADLSRYLQSTPDFITYNNYLMESCTGSGGQGDVLNCYEVRKDRSSALPLAAIQKRWAWPVTTSEFAQVNAFGHLKNLITRYHDLIRDIYYNKAFPAIAPPLNNYETAIPQSLYTYKAQWYGGQDLIAFADCDFPNNSAFYPSDFTICYGTLTDFPQVKMVQDPSVMHHELGHGISQMLMNFRNVAAGTSFIERSDISYSSYSEAGAIQEGVADYFEYAMNGRSRIGEWALIRFLDSGRPLDEDDPMHAPGISRNVEERLRYPDYLAYDAANPSILVEDVHYAGQTTSHFLTAFTRDLMETCSMNFTMASDTVLYLMTETYAELGDLTSTASDHSAGITNHAEPTINDLKDKDPAGVRTSKDWVMKVTPINYRSFFQTFAKYAYQILSKNASVRCNGVNYPIDNLEKLLDSYGLLLFKTYNENGNNYLNGHSGTNKTVNVANRLRSVTVSKNLIKLDPSTDASPYFVFDKRADMLAAVSALQQGGNIAQISSLIPSALDYNNGNSSISPGEIVGVALNLYNDSNSTMGGVEVLANDWDHAKTESGVPKPCNTFEDAWPLSTEGAASADSVVSAQGQCQWTTKTNGNSSVTSLGVESDEHLHPICFVQVKDGGTTKWVNQDILRANQGIDIKDCLGGATSRNDCFFRAIRGADWAVYSQIAPKKSWGKTLPGETGSPVFNSNNVLFFEVNPNTPPGTVFDCRFRVRFTNCTECYQSTEVNGDNWYDYEFSGALPFKIIHFQFTVID